jgi:hypothetical protein
MPSARARIAALAAVFAVLIPLSAPAETLRSELGISAVVVSSVATSYDPARPAGQRLALEAANGGSLDLNSVGLYVQDERYLDAGAAERAIEARLRGSSEPVVVSLVF